MTKRTCSIELTQTELSSIMARRPNTMFRDKLGCVLRNYDARQASCIPTGPFV